MKVTTGRKRRLPLWAPFLLVCMQLLVRDSFSVYGDDLQGDAEPKKKWRTAECCGINSLYLALRLHAPDKEISYAEIEKRLPKNQPGNSLAEMCDCAGSFGIKATVQKMTPEMLTQDRLPAIVHFEYEKGQLGHFVVVTAIGEDRIEYIDGTSAILQVVPMAYFRREWSGYTIIFMKRQEWQPLFVAAILLGAVSIVLAFRNWRGSPVGMRKGHQAANNSRSE